MELITISNIDCCICYESVDAVSSVIMTSCCKHEIHKMCFIQWILLKIQNPSCPVCGTSLSKTDVSNVLPKQDFVTLSKHKLKDKTNYIAAVIYDTRPPEHPPPMTFAALVRHCCIQNFFYIFLLSLMALSIFVWVVRKN